MVSIVIYAQGATPTSQLQQQLQRRQKVIENELLPEQDAVDGRVPADTFKQPLPSTNKVTKRCLLITTLQLQSTDKSSLPKRFYRYLKKTLKREQIQLTKQENTRFYIYKKQAHGIHANTGVCFSAQAVEKLGIRLQNILIDKGYVTTRVLIPEQNLNTGNLLIAIAVGRVGNVSVNQAEIATTHANRANLHNALPVKNSEILNLRDIEQGLENLRRVPTVTSDLNINPATAQNTSDIKVNWKQRKLPLRLSLSVDNSGSKITGEHLGTVSVALDNPLHLNDIFYASYTKNLTTGDKKTAPNGRVDSGKTHSYALSYSLPFGYWSINMGMSSYYFDQVVAGINRNYHYTGEGKQGFANLSKVLYRDSKHKITASIGGWHKSTKNYIDDVEVDVQRRRTSGWNASLTSRSYFKFGTLTNTLSYKRGTRAFGAIPAPEELFDEGTGKMKIWTADINWNMPFYLAKKSFNWNSRFFGQWNKSKLTAQDLLSIGGRYSVRGFNGELALSGERGWFWRNDLAWNYTPMHQIYLGFDAGHVSGLSTQYLSGKTLIGGVVGLKGQFNKRGKWFYDVFLGRPLKQPKGFNADSAVFGFNLNYSL